MWRIFTAYMFCETPKTRNSFLIMLKIDSVTNKYIKNGGAAHRHFPAICEILEGAKIDQPTDQYRITFR